MVVDVASTTVLHAQVNMGRTPQLEDGDGNGSVWRLTVAT
jgi:hypothetical protein